jgi:hypothetical protein
MPKRAPFPPELVLWQGRSLTLTQTREVAALRRRFRRLEKQGNLTGRPGETVPPSLHQVQDRLYRDLDALGRKHGIIADPAPILPSEPIAALQAALRQQRLALALSRGMGAASSHQGAIDTLWQLWRDRLPDHAPPPRPTVRTWEEAQAALDLAQRELERLENPRKPGSATRQSIPPDKRTRPMSYRAAAKHLGKGDSKDAAEWVSVAVEVGDLDCEQITRQMHVFNRDQFPIETWQEILPT